MTYSDRSRRDADDPPKNPPLCALCEEREAELTRLRGALAEVEVAEAQRAEEDHKKHDSTERELDAERQRADAAARERDEALGQLERAIEAATDSQWQEWRRRFEAGELSGQDSSAIWNAATKVVADAVLAATTPAREEESGADGGGGA